MLVHRYPTILPFFKLCFNFQFKFGDWVFKSSIKYHCRKREQFYRECRLILRPIWLKNYRKSIIRLRFRFVKVKELLFRNVFFLFHLISCVLSVYAEILYILHRELNKFSFGTCNAICCKMDASMIYENEMWQKDRSVNVDIHIHTHLHTCIPVIVGVGVINAVVNDAICQGSIVYVWMPHIFFST